jgi:tetratricopeptide (TPR) repeat protein
VNRFRKSRHDSAIRYARRALELKDDSSLRDDLAAWLEGIGSWSEAADLLSTAGEPANNSDRVRWHRRLASLWWRSGQSEQAARALAEIAQLDADCTEPLELLAGLHTNAQDVVSCERAVLAQLEAARRYQQHGARLAAFEAELRAFEIDPGSVLATEQLAISLTKLGRREAAEDVWRECAKVANDGGLYRQQIENALSRNEFDSAVVAGLDAKDDTFITLDSVTHAADYALNPTGAAPNTYDGILAQARLLGWLAARFEIALLESRGQRHASPSLLLTRLFASAMGRPELVVQSLVGALLTDPTSTETRRMLEACVSDEGDLQWTEQLGRVATGMALDPNALESLREVLVKWLELEPGAPVAVGRLAQLTEVLARQSGTEEPSQSWISAFDLLVRQGGETGCIAVAGYWLRRGRVTDALATLRVALGMPEPSQRVLGWVVTLARRMVEKRLFADALALMAKTTDSAVAAVLLAKAAEGYVELGERDIARQVVDGALAFAPNSARLITVDVNLQELEDPRRLAETLERALGIIPPRAQFALQLAQAHEELGNLELALAWAQRTSTLRPADATLRAKVAKLALATNDAARLTDWLIRSIDVPITVSSWLPTAAVVLDALIRIDAPRAAEATRRMMTAVGASDATWRATLLASADAVADARLALDVLERTVAAGADTAEALKEIVRRRLLLGDFEAAFEASLRALNAGVAPAIVQGWVPNLLGTASYELPDTELAAAELRRELSTTGEDQAAIVQALRRLAKDRYSLARDEASALSLWSELLQIEDSDVIEIVSEDMAMCLGYRAASGFLVSLCEPPAAPLRQGRLYTAAAFLLAQLGDSNKAQEFVGRALKVDPSNTNALFVAESLIGNESDQSWLDDQYESVARSTLGSYGERALHYRAAKIFETMGSFARALEHACAALIAVPREGVALRLAASLTRKVGDAQSFVDAVLTVVKRSQFDEKSARWLQLAQNELENREDFLPARVELLLHSLTTEPSVASVVQTTDAVLQLVAVAPEEGEVAKLRLARALRAKLEHADGPSGARWSLAAASSSIRLLDDELCAQALGRALRCDAAIEEYEQVESTLNWLNTRTEVARRFLLDALTVLDQPYVNVGLAALKAIGHIQLGVGDDSTLGRLDTLVARIGESELFWAWMAGRLGQSAQESSQSDPFIQQLVKLRIIQGRTDDALQFLQSVIQGYARLALAYDAAKLAVDLLLKHQNLVQAQQWVQSIRECLTPVDSAEIELQLARLGGDTLSLVRALAHRAYSDPSSPELGVAYLKDAIDLADRSGHQEAALECAQAAVKWDPQNAGAQTRLAALIQKTKSQAGIDRPQETIPEEESFEIPLVRRRSDQPSQPSNPEEESLEIPLVRRRSDQPSPGWQPGLAIDQALISPESDPESLIEAIKRATFMVELASPSYQTLTLLRRWLRRWPSSTRLLELVRDAAFVERDIPLSLAVEHARGVLLGLAERVEPPGFAAQPVVPEAVRALLFRDMYTAVSEALALLWEGGQHLIQRDLTEYGVTGLDRIGLGTANPLGQAYAEVSPRLGLLRTPLFHKRGTQHIKATITLSNPAAILLEGELPRDIPELQGVIAGALWATQPEYSLLMGASVPQVKTVLVALRFAFGPPKSRPPTDLSDALRLAEKLWESIPSAAQRHLRDLCLESLDYDRALELAQRARRRASLYAAGDLHLAIAQLSLEANRDLQAIIADPDIGANDPNVADLLRLATSAEYAAIRWQPAKESERRIQVLRR